MKVSIIIIAKNEEKCIRKCIKAAICALKKNYELKDCEIVIVDSNSSDRTFEFAKVYLTKSQMMHWKIITFETSFYTAALAREIGRQFSTGELVIFLDADMILYTSFIRYIKNKNVWCNKTAGVLGKRIDILYGKKDQPIKFLKYERKRNSNNEVLYPGGSVVYCRKMIKKIHFNIEQKTREEESFAKKVHAEDMKIIYIDQMMYLHMNYKRSNNNVLKRLNLVKEGSYDLCNSLKRHIQEYGIKSAFLNYYKELIYNNLLPFFLVIGLFLSFDINGFLWILFFLGVVLFLIKNKIRSFQFFFFLIGLFKRRNKQNYKIKKICKS